MLRALALRPGAGAPRLICGGLRAARLPTHLRTGSKGQSSFIAATSTIAGRIRGAGGSEVEQTPSIRRRSHAMRSVNAEHHYDDTHTSDHLGEHTSSFHHHQHQSISSRYERGPSSSSSSSHDSPRRRALMENLVTMVDIRREDCEIEEAVSFQALNGYPHFRRDATSSIGGGAGLSSYDRNERAHDIMDENLDEQDLSPYVERHSASKVLSASMHEPIQTSFEALYNREETLEEGTVDAAVEEYKEVREALFKSGKAANMPVVKKVMFCKYIVG